MGILLIRTFGVELSLGLSKFVECFWDSLHIVVDVLTKWLFAKFAPVFFNHLRWGSLKHGELNLVIWWGYAIYHQVGHGVCRVIIIICISFLLLNARLRTYVEHRLWFINLLRHNNVWISRTLLVNKFLHKSRFRSLRFLNYVQHLLFVEWWFLNVPAERWICRVRVFLISQTPTGWVQTLLWYLWTWALFSIAEVDLVYLTVALVLKHLKFLIYYAMSDTCALLTFLHIFLVRHLTYRGCYSDIVLHVGSNPKTIDSSWRFLHYILHHLWRVPTSWTTLLNIPCILTSSMAIGNECCKTAHIRLI